MEGDRHDPRAPGAAAESDRAGGDGFVLDDALARLEDVLLGYPEDRALPDLATILHDAKVSEDFLRRDDRALKVLHEAIVARPLSSHEAVARTETEVELLTLEVRVLTERLRSPDTDAETVSRANRRLAWVRHRMREIKSLL